VCYAIWVFDFYHFFVFCEVAQEPLGFAIAIEYQQVGADSVEEETVVAYNHCAALKVDDRLFKDPHCVYVEVICWFVEQDEVAASAKQFCKVDSVSFAS
jgi:hypothetical protein